MDTLFSSRVKSYQCRKFIAAGYLFGLPLKNHNFLNFGFDIAVKRM